jgi:hypothetical protein
VLCLLQAHMINIKYSLFRLLLCMWYRFLHYSWCNLPIENIANVFTVAFKSSETFLIYYRQRELSPRKSGTQIYVETRNIFKNNNLVSRFIFFFLYFQCILCKLLLDFCLLSVWKCYCNKSMYVHKVGYRGWATCAKRNVAFGLGRAFDLLPLGLRLNVWWSELLDILLNKTVKW